MRCLSNSCMISGRCSRSGSLRRQPSRLHQPQQRFLTSPLFTSYRHFHWSRPLADEEKSNDTSEPPREMSTEEKKKEIEAASSEKKQSSEAEQAESTPVEGETAKSVEGTTLSETDANNCEDAPAQEKADAVRPKAYSTPELAKDAAEHKAGMEDPDMPAWQNPLLENQGDDRVFEEDFSSKEEFEAAVVPAPPLDLGDGAPPSPEYLNELADEIVHLSVLEMNELANRMAEHFGFHEGMLSPDGQGAIDGAEDDLGAGTETVEEKTAFDLKLVEFDAKAKIKIIKEVRAMADLGLKEAKEWVESAPKVIMKEIKQEQADELKAKLEELGAKVEIV